MTATDLNQPVNQGSYDATVTAIVVGPDSSHPLHPVYGHGPIWGINAGTSAGGSISGQIFNDLNANGQKDPGELFTGQNVTVTLLDNDGNAINSLITTDGTYTFGGLPLHTDGSASRYVVQFDLPRGYRFISPVPAPPGVNSDVVVAGRTSIISINTGSSAAANIDAGIKSSDIVPVTGPGSFVFADPSYSVSESVSGGLLTITVVRGDSFAQRMVVVSSEDGTDTHGVNYQQVSATLVFAIGETIKTLNVAILNTHSITFSTDPKTFNLVLRDVTGKPLDQVTVYIGGQSYGSLTDDDKIVGGNGWNIIIGDSGNIPALTVIDPDPLYNNLGGIVYSGGPGRDTIHAGDGWEFVNGQLGNDTIYGDAGLDTLIGDMGNDVFYAGTGNELIDGGSGNDTIISTRDAPFTELAEGPGGTATLVFRQTSAGAPLNTIRMGSIEIARLYGGSNNNTFNLYGWSGSAWVVGGGGTDKLLVQSDFDMILRDASVEEGLAYQTMFGFYKDASLSLSNGATYVLSGLANISLTGGPSDNRIDASGYSQSVTFIGSAGNDTLIGGSGDDTFVFDVTPASPSSSATITGNAGSDTLDFSGSSIGVTADLSQVGVPQAIVPVSPGKLRLTLADKLSNITGGSGDDHLTGNDQPNIIIGGTGTDVLTAGTGNATFVLDTDTALGNKTIITDATSPGLNTLDFSGTLTLPITMDLANVGVAQVINANLDLTLVGNGIRQVYGGAQNDTIRGNSRNDILHGGLGDDLLQGRGGDDTLEGGPGHNTLVGGAGSNTVLAQGNADFTLTNTQLTVGLTEVDALDSIQMAQLTGGADANIFNLTGWTGGGSIDGGDVPAPPHRDTLIMAADSDFSLNGSSSTNATLTVTTGVVSKLISLTGIDLVQLTAGPAGHVLAVSNYFGIAILTGGDGNDTFNLGGGSAGYYIVDGGRGANNTLNENSSAVAVPVSYTVQSGSLFMVFNPAAPLPAQRLDTYANIQTLSITGGSVSNTFDLSGWRGGVSSLTLNGGSASDSLIFQQPAAGRVTLTNAALTFPTIAYTPASNLTVNFSSIESATLTGTSGDDVLDASLFAHPVTLVGGDGNDTLSAGSGATNTLTGGAGNDTFVSGAGNDTMQGGTGNNTYMFNVDAAQGIDSIRELSDGSGASTIDFSSASTMAATLDLSSTLQQTVAASLKLTLTSGNHIENIKGSAAGGALTGNAADNIFTISGGANTINGAGGNNTVAVAADANITLTGTALASSLRIGLGPWNTLTNIGTAQLTATGSTGRTIDATGFSGSTILTGCTGNDTLEGGSGTNVFIASSGIDTLVGGAGNDTFKFNADSPLGTDTITGNGGTDTLDFSATALPVTVNLATLSPSIQVVNANLSLRLMDNLEDLIGGSGNDVLTGNSVNNVIAGGPGADIINGGLGNNIISETRDADFYLTNTRLDIIRPSAFTSSDIRDAAVFIAKLQSDPDVAHTKAISDYLWSQFSVSAKQTLMDSTRSLATRQGTLISELNRVIQAGALYTAPRFSGITLGADTTELRTSNPTGSDLVRLNRWLLDDAYLQQIVTSHDRDALSNIQGAVLTGGAGDNRLDASAFSAGPVWLYGLDGNDTLLGGSHDATLVGGKGNDTYIFSLPTNSPAPLGVDTIIEALGEGYADTLVGLGASGVSVTLHSAAASKQYFFLNHVTNTIQTFYRNLSDPAPSPGANYQLLLTLVLRDSATGTNAGDIELSF